jgi:tRNA A-37 threonylcarbamoyl transferase component Bud32
MSNLASACGSNAMQNIEPSDSFTESQSSNASKNEKPPRKTRGYHNRSHSRVYRTQAVDKFPKPTKSASHDSEQDHHTFATATTASVRTSSFSEEDIIGTGMEVAISSKDSEMRDVEERYTTHSFPAGKHTFTVDTRYSLVRVVGSGAYGVVISSKDSIKKNEVAIKMVPKAFNDEIDAKRILREIKLLRHLKHENIIGICDMLPPNARYLEDYHDVYIIADLMETDLHRIIYSKQKLSIDHVQYFAYQLLRGLKYIHSAGVIHRDLKPSNLLVNSNCDLKICDFGLARGIHQTHGDQNSTMLLTEYVVTRWYRAPEIMLACHEYSKPIDIWSVGCIFAELIQRKPYFPGDDYIDQVRRQLVFLLSFVPHKNHLTSCLHILIRLIFS